MAVNGIIGIKLGMTQVFVDDGTLVGCTVLQAGPCVVVQRRTKQTDGYEAAQLGLVEFVKPQRVNKAMTGHFKKANVAPMKVLHEVRIEESKDETKVGDRVLVEDFKTGELVDVSGVSKGKGFQGGVKRWHYAGGDSTHGSMHHRAPGGIGGGAGGRDFWRKSQPAPAARSFALALARSACRHAQSQGKERSQRRRPQALEAKGHGPRARRLDPVASLASWRHGSRTKATRLQLRAAEEDASRCAALGAFGKTGRAEADGCGCVEIGYAQDQGASGSAGKAEPYEVGVAGSPWREPQPGTGEPQRRRCHAGCAEWCAALQRAEARLAGALEGRGDAAEPLT